MGFMDRFSLKGRKIAVTGGAQGIGRVVADALADCGADIGIFDIQMEKARATAGALRDSYGIRAAAYEADVTDPAQVDAAFAGFAADFGPLDGVFNNAGISLHEAAEEIAYDEWRRVLDVNLNGVFLVARAAGKQFIRENRPGSIVCTASMSASIVNIPQKQASYNASKAAVVHLAKSLAVEWAERGIRVNCISPGYTATEMTGGVRADWRALWEDATPMKRMARPDELAGAVVYLLSDAASFTTGCDIVIDGGFTLV